MRVFKFGGASVASADAVRHMAEIVKTHIESAPLVVVVSAMGKTTNLLEKLVPGCTSDHERSELRVDLERYHRDIASDLMPNNTSVQQKIGEWLDKMDAICAEFSPSEESYNYQYDQIVSTGELLSTTVIAAYLNECGVNTCWTDARKMIRTDMHYREGRVQWDETERLINTCVGNAKSYDVVLTQGFIGGAADGSTTTLGREGSDYSAAVLAYCLEAESVTIWKDVPGFLNADPKYFSDTVKIEQMPYNEAIELAYYGASVIHPKTVKPIQNKGIPLYIRSFLDPAAEGSVIGDYRGIVPETPLYIVRDNQMLLSVQPRDYSFIAEDNLQVIFGVMNELGIRVNLMQNSALSFSICMDHQTQRTDLLIEKLSSMFHVRYNDNLQLVTIRYYTPRVIENIVAGRPILLEQRSRLTEQIIVPNFIGKVQ